MARIQKRFAKGNVKNFITRTQAIRKLQISLQDFRKLCIFKGIYPREPRNKKKANKGSTAPVTFYYYKDIQYLQHEPLLNKFREHKSFMKKLTKYLNKGQVHQAHKLNSNKEVGFVGNWDLDNIVKERYPTFNEALRDLDDCLNMLFLFANLPTTDNKINNKVIKEANRLTEEWLTYVTEKRLIKKVFVSIKGVYYSCVLKGEEIRWTIPYKFPENMPSDIDFKIMLTFLEFYSTLLHFVLYKLYTDNGFIYPPKIQSYKLITEEPKNVNMKEEDLKAGQDVEGHDLNEEIREKALNADEQESAEEEEAEKEGEVLDKFEDSNKNKGDLLEQPSKYDSPQATLFEDFTFYIGREVSRDIIQFLVLACGGKTICEADLDMSEVKPDLSQVTHHICDRPVLKQRLANVIYIQPQWIFDSVNKGELQAANLYLPGEKLPPHLSPWGDAIGYDPTANNDDDSEDLAEDDVAEEDVIEEVEDEDDDLAAQKELEQEVKGVYKDTANLDETKKNKKKAKSAEEEEKDMKLAMMSNKQKKLYTKMQYSNKQKDDEIKKLKKRKQKLESKRK